MVMRHGIRRPTSASPAPAGYTRETWPSWPVDYGLLTPRGAKGATLLGEADRAFYQRRGLFDGGCPSAGSIVLKASGTPECPNCMKAKLYLKDMAGGATPVNESDMKDNASCAK